MKMKKKLFAGLGLLAAFALWTWAVKTVDVQPIGPEGSCVGFAAVNRYVHGLTGVHFVLYTLTDWLGLVPAAFCVGFAALGLVQWMKRKSLLQVDRSLFVLAGFYIVVISAYLLFEVWAVNFRPVLIEGRLEASYPSSTTLLVLCVIPTAAMQLRGRIQNAVCRKAVCGILSGFALFMTAGRLVSGVHWVTDIVGGVLLSAGLVMLYTAFAGAPEKDR